MEYARKEYDLVVVGGGIGGVVTAVTAARRGLSVALADDKAGLGGNACSEIGVSIDGAICFGQFAHMREGGPVEELKQILAAQDPFYRGTLSSPALLFWCREAGVDVYSELRVHAVDCGGRRVAAIYGSQGGTERNYRLSARQFVDASGDAVVAALAGCEFRTGREGRAEFGEILAPDAPDQGIMGASVLFRASAKKVKTAFVRPPWAYEYTKAEDLPFRLDMQRGPVEIGFWWIEYAGDHNDPIGEYESIRIELLKCLYGVWAFLKNDPARGMEYYSLDNVSVAPAKRESRRVVGDYLLRERDVVERTNFHDAVAYAGWNIDIHVPGGFKSRLKPNIHAHFPWICTVPLRCLYARDLENLWLVGRDISVSHVALGATRLQATIGTMGHAVGVAAALAHRRDKTTRALAEGDYRDVQQEILKDGSFIPGVRNEDPADHARSAHVEAGSELPLRFARGDEYLRVEQGRALSFPVTEGRIDTLVLPLRNPGASPVSIRLFLAACEHPNHFSHRSPLAELELRLEPGAHEVSWETKVAGLAAGLYAVLLLPEGEIEWLRSAGEPYGCYTAVYAPDRYLTPQPGSDENLYLARKPILLTPGAVPVEWDKVRRNRTGRAGCESRDFIPLPCVEISPAQHPYRPQNVTSGVSHTDRLPDLWISDPAAAGAQELILSWDTPRKLSSVRIVFDTDLDMNHPAPEPVDYLVKRYSVWVRTTAGWVQVAACSDNRKRLRRHEFSPCPAEAVKLSIEEIHAGGRSARVFEIRCY